MKPCEDCAGLIGGRREGCGELGGYPVQRRNGFARELGSVGVWGREIAAVEAGDCRSNCMGRRLWLCGMELCDVGARCARNRRRCSGLRQCWTRCSTVGSVHWCFCLRLVHTKGKSRPDGHRWRTLWRHSRCRCSRYWPCRSSWGKRRCTLGRLQFNGCNGSC